MQWRTVRNAATTCALNVHKAIRSWSVENALNASLAVESATKTVSALAKAAFLAHSFLNLFVRPVRLNVLLVLLKVFAFLA